MYLILLIIVIVLHRKFNSITKDYSDMVPMKKRQIQSFFKFCPQNYALRQSVNFVSIILIQFLFLSFEIIYKNSENNEIFTSMKYTTRVIPILILIILLLDFLFNFLIYLIQIKNSQFILKSRIIWRFIWSKSKENLK